MTRPLKALRILLLAVALAVALVLAFLLPPPVSVVVLNANVEALRFVPAVPEMARLRLKGYAVSFEAPMASLGFGDAQTRNARSGPAARTLCLDGLVTPTPGTVIQYERTGTGAVSIELRRDNSQAAAVFDPASGNLPEGLSKASWIRLQGTVRSDDGEKPARSCPGEEMNHLPLHGRAEIGGELRAISGGERTSFGTLIEGSLDILVRTIRLPFLDSEPKLYPASVSGIPLPPGARLSVGGQSNNAGDAWIGLVGVAGSDGGLQVRATTEATQIRLVRPGAGLQPEFIAVGLFTRLTNDPLLLQAQIAILFLLSAFGFVGNVIGWLARRSAPDR